MRTFFKVTPEDGEHFSPPSATVQRTPHITHAGESPLPKELKEKAFPLTYVKGFGEKRFNQVSAYLTVEGKTTLTSKISAPRKPRKSTSRQEPTPTASN